MLDWDSHEHNNKMKIIKYIATVGFIGYMPFAPGTWGSALAMLIFILFKPSLYANIIFLSLLIPIGIFASGKAETILCEKDPKQIVIDEVAGYALSVLSLPANLSIYFMAFLLFRFFDILKPPPIRFLESKVPGGTGIMLDDLIAAIYTNITIYLWSRIF